VRELSMEETRQRRWEERGRRQWGGHGSAAHGPNYEERKVQGMARKGVSCAMNRLGVFCLSMNHKAGQ